ncbi:MAG TPA: symmetrical bis(5'-nucleosyl)-tetraphosphatase [Thermoanaerobaculia bacterium]|nr:symmetrical bis(5'-nucleosyl)-tetraphosphatase [Thermoanaerobaculia bacterium]
MATYAIGDVHGCFATLRALLERIAFVTRHDRLWMVGDLVNRGPRSLEVLRWAAGMDERLVVVLGNHDLHLLARAAGVAETKRRDTLEAVLAAPDRNDLLAWLRARPLLHREGNLVLVHAGLFPAWTVEEAEGLARLAEERLRDGRSRDRLLAEFGVKAAERWSHERPPAGRARAALAAFARLRTLTPGGTMCPDFSGPPAEAPRGCMPWFEVPGRQSAGATVIFGHWAAMGLRLEPGIAALDTGCAWGRTLTALRLDDMQVFQQAVVDF